jgi:hypothetical protein
LQKAERPPRCVLVEPYESRCDAEVGEWRYRLNVHPPGHSHREREASSEAEPCPASNSTLVDAHRRVDER